jgi:hypothetical protein
MKSPREQRLLGLLNRELASTALLSGKNSEAVIVFVGRYHGENKQQESKRLREKYDTWKGAKL